MREDLLTVKEVALNNNCPECYSTEGLKLTFKQKFIENKLYKSLTNSVSTELECNKCHTTIYPVRWTDDIERVYEYQKKAFKPKKSTIKFKPLAWILFISIDLILLTIIIMATFPEIFGL